MRATVIRLLRTFRVLALVAVDTAAWCAAMLIAAGLRLETWDTSTTLFISEARSTIPLHGTLLLGGAAAVIHVLVAWMLRLHQGRSALGSFEELFGLASTVLVAGAAITVANSLVPEQYVPRTTPVVAIMIALVFSAWPRALWRILVVQAKPNRYGVVSTSVVIAGAGQAGRELVASMQRDPRQHWDPVAFVDDDRRKRHFRHRGVAVRGGTDDVGIVASRTGADAVVIAMPSVNSAVISRVYAAARAADLPVKVLPGVNELLDGISFTDVRDIEPADLLGRHQIKTDVEAIAGYLRGKRVLVTGAGGSIGSELCKQIARFAPAMLVMLDRDESALHGLTLGLDGRADLESPNIVLADIRDPARIDEVFAHHRPEVVFHAAALKHVNMLEQHPAEAVKTNVLGTLNVLRAAAATGVQRFVNISTDKAADPENVLGYSKRIAEGLTADFAGRTDGSFLSVRFGNVLGTRGSVLTTFTAQIERGGPVTVTDPEVTRFFMTVNEAVQLVIQAAAIGHDGEALVLDMGTPVRIMDVARQMIEQSGQRVDIVITGLKPGEKLHEVLFGADEADHRPMHPQVSHVSVSPLRADDIDRLVLETNPTALVEAMRYSCRLMTPGLAQDLTT